MRSCSLIRIDRAVSIFLSWKMRWKHLAFSWRGMRWSRSWPRLIRMGRVLLIKRSSLHWWLSKLKIEISIKSWSKLLGFMMMMMLGSSPLRISYAVARILKSPWPLTRSVKCWEWVMALVMVESTKTTSWSWCESLASGVKIYPKTQTTPKSMELASKPKMETK